MLGCTARGMGSCPQTALGFLANVIKPALSIPEEQKLLFGLSMGFIDEDAAENAAVTDRAALDELVRIV